MTGAPGWVGSVCVPGGAFSGPGSCVWLPAGTAVGLVGSTGELPGVAVIVEVVDAGVDVAAGLACAGSWMPGFTCAGRSL